LELIEGKTNPVKRNTCEADCVYFVSFESK